MIKINEEFCIYNFEELNKDAKEKAINDHISFWMETRTYDEDNKGNFEKACDEAESMNTPWFVGEYIYDYCKDEIIQELKVNNYQFYENGEFYN